MIIMGFQLKNVVKKSHNKIKHEKKCNYQALIGNIHINCPIN